jgi:hypothetical protein
MYQKNFLKMPLSASRFARLSPLGAGGSLLLSQSLPIWGDLEGQIRIISY